MRLVGLAFAVGVLLVGPAWADHLLEGEPTAAVRVGAVAIGVGAQVPWLAWCGDALRRADEYERAGLLEAAALGLAFAVVALALADRLAVAGFVGWGTLPTAWQTAILCGAAGVVVVRVRRRLGA